MEEFKYLGVLFTVRDEWSGRLTGGWVRRQMKKELSQKVKLSIYWSTYVPILIWSRVVGSDRKN